MHTGDIEGHNNTITFVTKKNAHMKLPEVNARVFIRKRVLHAAAADDAKNHK